MNIAVFLCDESGVMAAPWAEAGIECYCVDIAHSIRNPRREGNIHFVWGDARTWRPPHGSRVIFGAAFPVCTNVAVSGARDFATKGGAFLRDAIDLFDSCRNALAWSGAPYCVENPVGVLSSIPHIGKPNHYFDPCDFGGYPGGADDAYTKKTCLWTGNGFVMPQKRRIEPSDGSRMHLMAPSDDRQRQRSQTPRGFASAVFQANFVIHAAAA